MGQTCCGNGTGGEPELGYQYPEAQLNGKTYSARQIWIIVRIQCAFRMWLARRKVQALREEYYSPGMHRSPGGGEDYENINVAVSQILFLSPRPRSKSEALKCGTALFSPRLCRV